MTNVRYWHLADIPTGLAFVCHLAWRATLDEKDRRRLVHPLSNVRRWRASLMNAEAKSPQDLTRDAAAAWRRFVSCVEALPPDQAAPFWREAQAASALAMEK